MILCQITPTSPFWGHLSPICPQNSGDKVGNGDNLKKGMVPGGGNK